VSDSNWASPVSRKAIERLAVIGDLHGEHERLALALEWLHGQRVDAIVCTGDIADGRGCINSCCELLEEAGVECVAGNHDRWLLEDRVRHLADAHTRSELNCGPREFLTALPRQRSLTTTRGPMLLCHGIADDDMAKVWPGSPRAGVRRSETLDAVLATGDFRFLVNGHMHFRVLIDFESLLLLNAGTLKGEHGGFSIVDFTAGSVSAFEFDDLPPRRVCERSIDSTGRRVWQDTQAFDGDWSPATLYAAT
jgi:predicted phosphodiesterase